MLQIVATDNGVGVSLSGTAEVTVYLTDVNDNDPIFLPSQPEYIAHSSFKILFSNTQAPTP